MIENVLFNFTDECGVYNKERSEKFNKANQFYVRSNYMITTADYIELEKEFKAIKEKYGVNYNVEIKWQHYGSRKKKTKIPIPHDLDANQIETYIEEILDLLAKYSSSCVYYTFTSNEQVGAIDAIKLLKMHLQNAFQRLQKDAKDKKRYGILIADELNDKTKKLKKALFEITSEGDQFTKYTNIHKGFFVDQSDQSCGLQIADILAGVFTAALKYQSANDSDKSKFQFGHDMFVNKVWKIIRFRDYTLIPEIYKSGIKEIPSNVGKELAEKICKSIDPAVSKKYFEEFFS